MAGIRRQKEILGNKSRSCALLAIKPRALGRCCLHASLFSFFRRSIFRAKGSATSLLLVYGGSRALEMLARFGDEDVVGRGRKDGVGGD